MRRSLAGAGILAAGLALAGCGGSHPTATAPPTSTPPVSTTASPAPTDCQRAGGTGAHQAAYVVMLLLGVDYRNQLTLPSVVQPLLASGYYTTFRQYLTTNQQTIQSQKLREAVTVRSTTYASGDCTVPVYAVAVTRTSSTATKPAQSQAVTVRASMAWNGTTYVLTQLSSS